MRESRGSSSTFLSLPLFALAKDTDLLRLHILSAAVQAIIGITEPAQTIFGGKDDNADRFIA